MHSPRLSLHLADERPKIRGVWFALIAEETATGERTPSDAWSSVLCGTPTTTEQANKKHIIPTALARRNCKAGFKTDRRTWLPVEIRRISGAMKHAIGYADHAYLSMSSTGKRPLHTVVGGVA